MVEPSLETRPQGGEKRPGAYCLRFALPAQHPHKMWVLVFCCIFISKTVPHIVITLMVYVNYEPSHTPYFTTIKHDYGYKVSTKFATDVSYALSCLKRSNLVLKPGQEAAIRDIYDGNDVFAWLPTGYGKSICYQVKFSLICSTQS